MHPLVNDLSNFTEAQLQEKVVTLKNRYFMSPNTEVQEQISLLIDTYNLEIEKRNREKLKKQDPNNDLDNLINVS